MKELREAKMNRNTAETQIELELRIDGTARPISERTAAF